MARRHSFRLRVAAAFAGLGATLSILLSAGIWIAALDVSQRLMDQTLKAELDDYMARRERNPRSLPPNSASQRGSGAKALEDRQWVEVVGHRETPVRSALSATTETFLDDLGLRSVTELPPLEMMNQTLELADAQQDNA